MENVGTVFVYMETFCIFTVHISANMIPLFQDQALLSLLLRKPGKDTGVQSASY